ncbi:flagellar biosynthesis protein FlhF [Pelovirga terrestris]|uniref:Flagellar biosynthesis protein FlhF n=1 Tax=Pelovirga terrestris TaxID=2771352 RepID=A0A8J6QUM0_9BACT|nr:flagellar biosynthesis protein FlhF [Pelovirga terrestris]MBD1400445.1 flagellar biosynthesis protein FlhF [Pelovirga terrestris]
MLVKKFEAETMAAALKQVKDTLGPEALILSTRTLRKKGLGVLGRQTIEVTAAVESPSMRRSSLPARNAYSDQRAAALTHPVTAANRVETLEDEIVSLSGRNPAAPQPAAPAAAGAPAVDPRLDEELRRLRAQSEAQSISQLKAEIEQLKALMNQLAQAQAQAQKQQPAAVPESVELRKPSIRTAPMPLRTVVASDHPDPLVAMLQERGIDAESATTIAAYAATRMTSQQRLDIHQQREFLCTTLAGLVQSKGTLWRPGQPQKKLSLIGATGVGKTTTIAKLAAQAITETGARVALVTIDTYRIAAVEQLKVYGEIMGIPVDVVFSPEQLQETFRRHRDKDLILIDTAGRSPKDVARIDELNSFLGAHSGVENCLVLAAPTADSLQHKSFEAFSKLPISRLMFTKLDEADQCGSLINLPLKTNLPIGCLTNGQKVPEDLLPADPQLVADLVMGSYDDARRIAV